MGTVVACGCNRVATGLASPVRDTEPFVQSAVLVQALQAIGRDADAHGAARHALVIAELKGHALFAWRARSMLAGHAKVAAAGSAIA
jgi:hypothetical protein